MVDSVGMEVVFKYVIDVTRAAVPKGKVLAFAFQNGVPTAWIQHSSGSAQVPMMEVLLVPTGVPIHDANLLEHLGTAVSDELVFHLYRML